MLTIHSLWLTIALSSLPVPDNIRQASKRAVDLLMISARGHAAKQTCFACHNQTLPLLAAREAKNKELDVSQADLDQQSEHIVDFLDRNLNKYRKGEGTGGQVDTAGYALFALELAGQKPNDATGAVVEYLLKKNADKDHWPCSSNRPPSEASHFSTTYFAMRGLRVWAADNQKHAVSDRRKQVTTWIEKAPAKDHEDRVFRLFALKELSADPKWITEERTRIEQSQRADGSWAQLPDRPGDAYATGTALVALHRAGELSVTSATYRRGVAYLLRSQRVDGSWYVKSRSKPFQPYYETGFPHEKDQFISASATGWAATALLDALPNISR